MLKQPITIVITITKEIQLKYKKIKLNPT